MIFADEWEKSEVLKKRSSVKENHVYKIEGYGFGLISRMYGSTPLLMHLDKQNGYDICKLIHSSSRSFPSLIFTRINKHLIEKNK
ncbi:hypothetical protein DVH26_35900 [Paenibacillus sp. H1-7]|nr:hypothetical protein DVH26_35900 [Paenibacillus sp. H1-7]